MNGLFAGMWKATVVVVALLIIWALMLLTVRPDPTPEPHVHKILAVPTDHEDVVCFFRLSAVNEPQDMSCVYKGEQEWITQRPTTIDQW